MEEGGGHRYGQHQYSMLVWPSTQPTNQPGHINIFEVVSLSVSRHPPSEQILSVCLGALASSSMQMIFQCFMAAIYFLPVTTIPGGCFFWLAGN